MACYQRTLFLASRRHTVWKGESLSKRLAHSGRTGLYNDSPFISTILPIEILDSPEDLGVDVLRDILPGLHAIIFVIDINVGAIYLTDNSTVV